MVQNHNGENAARKSRVDKSPVIIDFGTRAVSDQNFSKIVALPKQALTNCGIDKRHRVRVQLVQEKGEKFIKLSPQRTEVAKDE